MRPERKSCRVLVLIADARTVRPDRRQLPHLRPPHAPAGDRTRHRRRADQPPDPRRRARRRSSGGDTGPPARSRAVNARSRSTRSKCSCSTKPTACSTWASSTTSVRSSPMLRKERQTLFFSATMPQEIAKLADLMLSKPGARRGDAAGLDRRAHRPARHPDREVGQERAAGRNAARPRPSTAFWCSPAPSTAPTRSSAICRSPASAPRRSTATSRQDQRERVLADFRDGKLRIAGRHRHRGPRHRRRRHQPRRQLRPAEHSGMLRPPHRPHRARRRRRHRDLVLRSRRSRRSCATSSSMIRMTIPSVDKRTGIRPASRPARPSPGQQHRPNRGRQHCGG